MRKTVPGGKRNVHVRIRQGHERRAARRRHGVHAQHKEKGHRQEERARPRHEKSRLRRRGRQRSARPLKGAQKSETFFKNGLHSPENSV